MEIEVEEKAHSFELISQDFTLRYKTGMFNHITGADHVKEIDLKRNSIYPVLTITGVKIIDKKKYIIIKKQ